MKTLGKVLDKIFANRVTKIGSIVVLAIVTAICGLYVGGAFDEPTEDRIVKIKNYDKGKEEKAKSKTGGISIPGYTELDLKADKKGQSVILSNPTENKCYFKMSLILEDKTVVWTSKELLEPGKAFDYIRLDKTLKKGEYKKAKLKYDCYALKNKEQLNGAEINLTLIVS